jgi:hypothetical protein
MAMKALLQGNAGNYRIRGAIWDLGSFAYRAHLHLIPATSRPDLFPGVVSAGPLLPPLPRRHRSLVHPQGP